MKTLYTLILFLAIAITLHGQITSWDFSTGAQGWTLANSLAGSVSGGVYHMGVTGSDPYMLSPNLIINPTVYGQVHIRLKNGTSATQFQLFWQTNTDLVWNQQKSIFYTVQAHDTAQRDYYITSLGQPFWNNTIHKLRLDFGDNSQVGDSVLLEQVNFVAYDMGLDNGTVHVRLDLTRGGSISYISSSGSTRSLVNIADEGRYIQQSYYGGKYVNRQADGQAPNWSPWPWNPIQAGDAFNNRAIVLSFNRGADTLYTKSIPMQWDMDSMPAEADMEQWTSLNGNIINVKCRLTCHRTDTIYGEASLGQELPAVYIISALSNLYTYIGIQPFTNQPAQQLPVVNLSSGFWGIYDTVGEHWMAFLDNTLWGMAVYNPITTVFLAGQSGTAGGEYNSASTDYIAPGGEQLLKKNSVFEYSYNLVLGTLAQIRTAVYQLHGTVTGASPPPLNNEISIYPNPAHQMIYIQLAQEQPEKMLMVLFNMQGQLILEDKIEDTYPIDVSKMPKGIYFLRLTGKDKVWTKKIVVE